MNDWAKIALGVIAITFIVFNKSLAKAGAERASWISIPVLRAYYVAGSIFVILAVLKSLFWP